MHSLNFFSVSRRRQAKRTQNNGRPPKYQFDFYSKSQHLRARLRQLQNDEGDITIAVARNNLFEDSFAFVCNLDSLTLTRRLHIKFDGVQNIYLSRLHLTDINIFTYLGEEGLDYGGMSREWFLSLANEILEGKHKLFIRTQNNEYRINPYLPVDESLLDKYYFVGLILGLAVYHGKIFPGQFIMAFYKALLEREVTLDDLKPVDEQVRLIHIALTFALNL